MKNKKNRKKTLAIATIVATLLLIAAGTYAFTAYTEWVKNHFQSSGMEEGKVTIVEKFEEPTVVPGGRYEKKVTVKNTGAGNYFARMSFEEAAQRLLDTAEIELIPYAATGTQTVGPVAAKFPVIVNTSVIKGTYDLATPVTDFKVGNAAKNDATLYLLKNTSNPKEAMLVKEVEVTADMFPANFDTSTIYGTDGEKLPAKLTAAAKVYQKVSIKEGTGNISWNESSSEFNVNGEIEYSQFNTSYSAAPYDKDGDWTTATGSNVFVTDTTGAAKKTPTLVAGSTTHYEVESAIDPQITLSFADGNVTLTAPVAGDASAEQDKRWFYNDADGYFYYLGVLTNSEADSESSILLNEVYYGDSKANLLSAYDLYVGLEAIPATQAGLVAPSDYGAVDKTTGTKNWNAKSGSGWGLETTSNVYAYFNALAGLYN